MKEEFRAIWPWVSIEVVALGLMTPTMAQLFLHLALFTMKRKGREELRHTPYTNLAHCSNRRWDLYH